LIVQGSEILNRHLAAITLVCALLFTACNGAASPTNTPIPVSVVEPTAIPASAVPVKPSVAPVPTSEATIVPEPTAITSNSIQVAGDPNTPVEADNFYIAPVKADDVHVVGTMLYLNHADTHVVFIRFPKDAQPGTYPIVSGYTEDFDGSTTTANYIDQTHDPAMQFAATGGTLTIQSVGDAYTGTFEFPAVDDSGKIVTVSGTFVNLKLP
jgi:hypothetical protein